MKILFGLKLDGCRWTRERASLDSVTYGPIGMLEWLEKYLGIDGINISQAERINQYLEKIKETEAEWCRKSLNIDSWSTSKQLLSWRDELILNGWNREDGESSRIKTLSLIEKSPSPLAPGIPDRLEKIIREAQSACFNIKLEMMDDSVNLPYLWKEVIRILRERGAQVSSYIQSEPCCPQITTVKGENEFTLARECVRFLSSGDNSSVAIVAEDGTYVLDGILHEYGLGAIGNSVSSKWRESLEILPLWLKTLWKPFNAQDFLSLLKLPFSPIPHTLGYWLSKAVQKAPGFGGDEWNNAWKNAEERTREKHPEDYEDRLKKLEEMRTILNSKSFFAGDKVSEKDVIDRCNILKRILCGYVEKHQEVKIAISHAEILSRLVSGKGEVTEIELDRMLDSIIGAGTDGDRDVSEYTGFDVYKNPGMITKDYDTIIWWNCVNRDNTVCTNWTRNEVNVLKDYCRNSGRAIDILSWHNAVNHARKNLLCFIPKVINGEMIFSHPLLDEFDENAVNKLTEFSLIDENGLWSLLDRTIQLEKKDFYKPQISNKFNGASFKPEKLSYSELSDLIACPAKWMFKYHIGLQQTDSINVPTGNRMIGTLAHKVVENIYKGRRVLSENEALNLAEREFDTLLPQMAAELMRRGSEVELERARKILISSVVNLVREVNRRSLKVCSNEMELEGEFEGIPFKGFSDIVLEDTCGNKFVIDMKWSTNKDYRENYENGKALQLAVYSLLLDDGKNINCAYYLFPKKDFICEDGKDWLKLIERAKKSYQERLCGLKNGVLTKGEKDNIGDFPDFLTIKPNCSYCDFKDFCSVLEEINE